MELPDNAANPLNCLPGYANRIVHLAALGSKCIRVHIWSHTHMGLSELPNPQHVNFNIEICSLTERLHYDWALSCSAAAGCCLRPGSDDAPTGGGGGRSATVRKSTGLAFCSCWAWYADSTHTHTVNDYIWIRRERKNSIAPTQKTKLIESKNGRARIVGLVCALSQLVSYMHSEHNSFLPKKFDLRMPFEYGQARIIGFAEFADFANVFMCGAYVYILQVTMFGSSLCTSCTYAHFGRISDIQNITNRNCRCIRLRRARIYDPKRARHTLHNFVENTARLCSRVP